MNTLDAVILGGGSGSRFSESDSAPPKQFHVLNGAPVFIHSVRALLGMDCFRQIVIAMPKHHLSLTEQLLQTHLGSNSKTLIRVIAGGATRQQSSYLALEAIESLTPLPTRILIHDACRPFLSSSMQARVRQHLLDRSYGAWVPVIPVVDTLKRVENHQVVATADRSQLFQAQTPQIFEFAVIRALAEKAKSVGSTAFTDDVSLCEYYGIPVGVFEGDVRNLKMTYEFELETMRSLLESPKKESSCASESAMTSTV